MDIDTSKETRLVTCGLCHTVYCPEDPHESAVHEHCEPQSGPLREAWLASTMPWGFFESEFRKHFREIDQRRLLLYRQAIALDGSQHSGQRS